MARITVKRDTRNIDNYTDGLKDIDPIIKTATIKLQAELLKAYSRASNLSDHTKNKPLTDDYKEKKTDSGRNGVRDLNVTGALTQSFGVQKESTATYSTGPRGAKEQKIMEGNIGYDDNLMKVGGKATKSIVQFVNDRIKKGGK